MKSYRIGKDITNRLHVLTNGKDEPLNDRELSLQLVDPHGCKKFVDFSIEDGLIIFTYYGIKQKILGQYGLSLWENYGKHGQTVVDCNDAFFLVPDTSLEGGTDPEGLDTEVNDLTIDISTGVRGNDGVGINDIIFNPDFSMTITKTDGQEYT